MGKRGNLLRAGAILGLGAAFALGVSAGHAQRTPQAQHHRPESGFSIDGQVALHALMSLGDGHLRKTADVLTLLAGTEAARAGDWDRIRASLATTAGMTVPAVHWFSLPDGSYATLEGGRAAANLSDRPYFADLLAGRTVIGDLVVSRSTRRNTAIVAVPIVGHDGSVVGALGSSIHLDSLSAIVREEMGGLDDRFFFFAIDEEPLGALHSDAGLIFTEPMKLGDEGMRRAFTEILAGQDGAVEYTFRDVARTVLYRRSPVTGWWYGFGMIRSAGAGGSHLAR